MCVSLCVCVRVCVCVCEERERERERHAQLMLAVYSVHGLVQWLKGLKIKHCSSPAEAEVFIVFSPFSPQTPKWYFIKFIATKSVRAW